MRAQSKAKTALVIGAGSGIGRAVAHRFFEDGYDLVLADIELESLSDWLQKERVRIKRVDISNVALVKELAKECTAGVDALVVTAGLSMSMASFERIMDVNLCGLVRVIDAFGPVMNGGGTTVCLSSISGHLMGSLPPEIEKLLADPKATDWLQKLKASLPAEMRTAGAAYGLSKFAILGLVQRTAVAWGARGVRVVSISPGCIDTPMGELERTTESGANAAIPLGPIPRLGAAREVANVAAFLCSSDASFITACDILVDGGWVGAIKSSDGNSPFARVLLQGNQKT